MEKMTSKSVAFSEKGKQCVIFEVLLLFVSLLLLLPSWGVTFLFLFENEDIICSKYLFYSPHQEKKRTK